MYFQHVMAILDSVKCLHKIRNLIYSVEGCHASRPPDDTNENESGDRFKESASGCSNLSKRFLEIGVVTGRWQVVAKNGRA
jgi:hypothetical protein